MKPSLQLIIALTMMLPALHAAQTTWQLPAQKCGTGSFDRYNLAASVGDDPAVYFVSIALKGKLDVETARVHLSDGTELPIIDRGVAKAYLNKFPWVNVELSRQQMELASLAGTAFLVKSSKGEATFRVPADQFSVMLRDADKHDLYRPRAELAKLIKDFDPALVAKAGKGSAKITGQAFLKTRGGEVRLGAGNSIMLMPEDSWTKRAVELMKTDPSAIQFPREISAYIASVIRTQQADAQGNFEFTDLPEGKYRLRTLILWEVPAVSRYGMETTGGEVETVALVEAGGTARVMLTR